MKYYTVFKKLLKNFKIQRVENTANNPNPEWLNGRNPNAIENQEAQGQSEFINSTQLPINVNTPRNIEVEKQYKLMGIKIIGKSKGDDLFFDVELPKGWKKENTDHSMWSNLLDDKGRERASIFYKAAFYDRDAFINFKKRYYWTSNYYEDEKIDGINVKTAVVKDSATKTILFESEKHTFKNAEQFEIQAQKFLSKNYPKANDINAYWD